MRSRNRLLVSRLSDFVVWAVGQGWQYEAPKGSYEVARLVRNKQRATIWRRETNAAGTPLTHLTLDRVADVLFSQWVRERSQ